MKKLYRNFICLAIPFLAIGCSGLQQGDNSNNNSSNDSSAAEASSPSRSSSSSARSSSASSSSSSSIPHTHNWAATWSSDATNHWHACDGCNEKKDSAAHQFGNWTTVSLGEYLNDPQFNLSTIKYRVCSTCEYRELDQTVSALPELRFTFGATDSKGNVQATDFATSALSTDSQNRIERPKVEGNLTITNAGTYNTTGDGFKKTTMKVRGNQTAGFGKKGFQINLKDKSNLLGLNKGKSFKKWVLLADAKDSTISRTALGLTMCKGVIASNSNVWSSDFTPVSLYLNDEYWGLYMLAEQKEVKKNRIKLDEPVEKVPNPDTGEEEEVDITTPYIGYNFELDHYATQEAANGADGDPTFSINYNGYTRKSLEGTLANSTGDPVRTFTLNSDITDSTADEDQDQHTDATNSAQVAFIQGRVQALWEVLYNAAGATNKVAKDINDSNEVIDTQLSIKQTIEKNFDLNAWAEGFVINGVCCPPDLGYSSFYMSYNNAPDGDHKLRYDVPWDFDSNFGNRRNFITSANSANGTFGPYYLDRTSNPWIQMLNNLEFFINDYVKPKWNAARENQVFEGMINMAKVYYEYYEGEYVKNFTKWDTVMPTDQNVRSYFVGDGVNSGELRNPFVNVSDRKAAQKETLNWLTKRVNYLEGVWGNGTRQALPTIA